MLKNDSDKSIDMLASGGAAVLANDGAATGCVEVTEAGASDANTSKPLDEKSDNGGYVRTSAGVGDEDGAGVDAAQSTLSNEEAAEAENLEPVVANTDRRLVYRVVKRTFDVVFLIGVTVVLAIPVAIACVAILMESPGAPMYSQERIGKGGKVIRVLKLCSMVADTDDVEKHLDPDQLKQWEMERKVDDDPRVTLVGEFIRKTSLDELPQFLNVLKGGIPLHMLKTRPEFSMKYKGAFALPARLARTRIAASLQFRSAICAIVGVPQDLFEYSIAGYGEMRGVFAKRDFRIDSPLLGRFLSVSRNGLSI